MERERGTEIVAAPDADGAEPQPKSLRVGILTISDRCSRGEMQDGSGPAIQTALRKTGGPFIAAVYACIPDDRKLISRTLRRWADDDLCDCILTTGGTGLSERDVTPEATERVLDQRLAALAMQIALQGAKSVPTAVLSRGVAGTRGRTVIVNLPGSPSGAAMGAKLLAPILPHAVEILRGGGHGAVPAVPETPDADL